MIYDATSPQMDFLLRTREFKIWQASEGCGISEAWPEPSYCVVSDDGRPAGRHPLIDPPLHEFLPSYEELLVDVTHLQDRLAFDGGGADGARSPLDAVGDRVTLALEKGLQKVLGRKDAERAMKLLRREGR